MNCEICGSEIKGQPLKVKIDNSLMMTCKECSKYGKVQKKPQTKKIKTIKRTKKTKKNQGSQKRQNNKRRNRRDQEEYELCDNYTTLIRQARENKKLTQKKLGEKIYEKESVIAHIESGKMVPDNKLAHKLENILNIKIMEKVESDEREHIDVARYKEATLGDIANIKYKNN